MSALPITCSSSIGAFGLARAIGVGSLFKIESKIATVELPVKALRPQAIS